MLPPSTKLYPFGFTIWQPQHNYNLPRIYTPFHNQCILYVSLYNTSRTKCNSLVVHVTVSHYSITVTYHMLHSRIIV